MGVDGGDSKLEFELLFEVHFDNTLQTMSWEIEGEFALAHFKLPANQEKGRKGTSTRMRRKIR